MNTYTSPRLVLHLSLKGRAVWPLLLLGALAGAGGGIYPGRADESTLPGRPATTAKDERRPDADPLPQGVVARLGSTHFRHAGLVWCLAFSPDAKTVASTGRDQLVRFWDVQSGRQLRVSGHYRSSLHSLAYSPDGSTVAVPICDPQKPGISLLDASTARERRFVPLPSPGNLILGMGLGAAAFSPDGKILASITPSGEVGLLDAVAGKELAALGKHDHPNVPILVFGPDGRTLASSGQDATIRLWDVKRRKALFVLRSEDRRAFPLAFSRDGKWLISGGGTQEALNDRNSLWGHPAIRTWDVATGKQLRVFKDTDVRGAVRSLALAPDGRTLAVSCEDKLRLWDVVTGKVLRTLSGARSPSWSFGNLCFSPNGKILAGSIRNMVGLWDVESGRLLNLDDRESASDINCVALSGDGRLLAAGDGDGYLSLWDYRTRRLVRRFRGHNPWVRRLAFSPDDRTLASISEYGRLRAWNVADGRERYHFPVEAPKDSRPTELVYSPDGKLLAYAYFFAGQGPGPRGICLLDAATGAEKQNLTIPPAVHGWFKGIGFSPDGRHLIGTTVDGEIYGWKKDGHRFAAKGPLGKNPFGCSVAYTGRGFLTVDVFANQPPTFRDYETGRSTRGLPSFPPLGDVLAFSRDGRYLAAAPTFWQGGKPKRPLDTALRVCEMATGQEVFHWQLPPHTPCLTLAFAADGRTLVGGLSDTTVLIWDLCPVAKDAGKVTPALWADLADNDAAKAYRARCRLLAAPAETLTLLRRHLKPVEDVYARDIQRLLADLDADAFAVRERATEELRKLGELAEPACRKALASRPSLEMRRRLQGLLDETDSWRPSPELLRQERAVEVLEHLGTLESRKLLESLAGGAPGVRLTRAARAAVRRLDRREKIRR